MQEVIDLTYDRACLCCMLPFAMYIDFVLQQCLRWFDKPLHPRLKIEIISVIATESATGNITVNLEHHLL